jgi:ubiquitin C-terminal hydrolase
VGRSVYRPIRACCIQVLAQPKKCGYMSPRKLVRVIQQTKPEFHSPMHQDAQELLSFLLNHICESMRSLSAQIEQDRVCRQSATAGDTTNSNGGVGNGLGSSTGLSCSKRSSQTSKSSITDAPTLIDEIFVGKTVTNTLCVSCENLSRKQEVFKEFQVEIHQTDTTLGCCMGSSRCVP